MANMVPPENDRSMNETASGNEHIINEEESDTNAVASEISSTANVPSTDNSRLQLLSLPAELRLMIFRHLLVEDRPLPTHWRGGYYNIRPDVLTTCKKIRREAFEIMYGENTFWINTVQPNRGMLNNQQIKDTIRNVHVDVQINDTWPHGRRLSFIRVLRAFGSPAIVRGTLNIVLHVVLNGIEMLPWLVGALPRCINFRIVQIELEDGSGLGLARGLCLILCNTLEAAMTPVFGPAQSFADGYGLRFYPQEHLNSLLRDVDADWMDRLDGIRLNWNQDPLTNAHEPDA